MCKRGKTDPLYRVPNAPSDYVAQTEDYEIDAETYRAKSCNERARIVVLHYTAGTKAQSIDRLTRGPVSAHYLISDHPEDPIYQLVAEDKRAWHAGVSYWRGRTNINDSSIGIETVNPGYELEDSSMIFKPFKDHQIQAIGELVQDLIKRYSQADPTNIVGHADVAPGRKVDPGAKFPWKYLHDQYGVGAWYDQETMAQYLERWNPKCLTDTTAIEEIQQDFGLYGYKIEPSGQWDEQTKKVVSTFQLHFRPALFDGLLDGETHAILQALLDKYRRRMYNTEAGED